MSTDDTLARISALEARITALETANARLVEVASRLFHLIEDRTLWVSEWVSEELAERDGEAAATTAELVTAIRSRAPRGFKIPIAVMENVYRSPDDREAFLSWITALHNLERCGGKLELLLLEKGLINNSEHTRTNGA